MPVSFYTRWILRQLFGVDFSVEAMLLNEFVCEVHALPRTQVEEAETLGPALTLSTLWILQGNSQWRDQGTRLVTDCVTFDRCLSLSEC